MPYPHNALFTGREELLTQLEVTLHAGHRAALSQPQAISGLGGVGKTQIALEYAYRHQHEYQAVLWAQADTREALTTSYLALATLLNLPEKDAPESDRVIAAVKQWLTTHTNWLLVLDNADGLALARDFLPPQVSGHVLLTTRAQAMGRFARRVEVDVLPMEVGALFLLRRAELLDVEAAFEQAKAAQRDLARSICEELGGLPLALDQAGAYIEETGCSLMEYHHLFQRRSADLLARRGGLVEDHPMPVASTWSLSFEKVEEMNPAAADLLRVCAFLAPDAIPETIITKGASQLGSRLTSVGSDPSQLDEAIATLRAYSLVRRESGEEAGNLLWVHRLVQAVLQDAMDEQGKKEWAQRVVQALSAAFPSVEHQNWSLCDRLVPHAQVGTDLIRGYGIVFSEAARLLNQAGVYLSERARYQEAEPLLERSLSIDELNMGVEHPDTASSLNNLAMLYRAQGKYALAESLLKRALAIREQKLGAEHPDTAQSLNNLAVLYRSQGKYIEAEPLLERALAIREQKLGAEYPDTAQSLNSLALLYHEQGKYAQAEPLYVRALAIREQKLGASHPDTSQSLNNLAALYYVQGRFSEAEPLYQRALSIHEQELGAEHPDTAQSLNNLAELYRSQGKYVEAEPLFLRALAIREQQLGAEHPATATSLNNLALFYYEQRKDAEAEPLLKRALTICEQKLGAEHSHTAQSLNNLAILYYEQGKDAEAEPLFLRALAIRELQLGVMHPDTAQSLNNLALFYESRGKDAEAKPLYERALSIGECVLGQEHQETQTIRKNYARLLQKRKRDAP